MSATGSPTRRRGRQKTPSVQGSLSNVAPEEPRVANVAQAEKEQAPGSKDSHMLLTPEDSIDIDFMYFVTFAKSRFDKLTCVRDKELSQAWLQKICGEITEGIDAKRNRNIYLSQLILDMDCGRLSPPFNKYPPPRISNAELIFGLQHSKIEPHLPDILEEDDPKLDELNYLSKDGHMYLASRMLPDGGGAFGYLAISTAKESLMESSKLRHSNIQPKSVAYQEEVLKGSHSLFTNLNTGEASTSHEPETTEDSIINDYAREVLGQRRPPQERDDLIEFYDNLLLTIEKELEASKCPAHNIAPLVQQMLVKLEQDLMISEENDYFHNLSAAEKTTYLLEVLQQRLIIRKNNLLKRGEMLDHMEQAVQTQQPEGILEIELDQVCLKAADRAPSQQSMKDLLDIYPQELVERFVILLREWCHEELMRSQTRYDSVLVTLKKDLEAEKDIFTEEYKKVEEAWHETQNILKYLEDAKAEAEKGEKIGLHTTKQHRKQQDDASQLQAEFKMLQIRFDNELKRHALLREQINTEHQHMREILQRSADCMKRLLMDEEALLVELENLEDEIDMQKKYLKRLHCFQLN